MDDESLSSELDEATFHQGLFDDRQVFKQAALESIVPDVARRNSTPGGKGGWRSHGN